MPANDASQVPAPNPEQRRIAAGQFDRANQVIATGNYDYGIRLLLSCCKIDPGNLIYRQALRRTEKTKYKNNLRGHWLAWLTTPATRARIKAALGSHDYLKVLEFAEHVLARNPWDTGTQLDMAQAADELGLLDLAIWTLEQARQKNARDVHVNRALARYYEKRGNYTQAIALWELVRKAIPEDAEAGRKAKDLAASETIARGGYRQAATGADPGVPRPGVAPAPEKKDGSGRHQAAAPGTTGSGRHQAAPATTGSGNHPVARESSPQGGGERGANEIARLEAKIAADPTVANAYVQLAQVHRRLGQVDQARKVLQAGLGPTGNSFELNTELADLEIEGIRRNLAIAEEKLRKDPDNEDLRRLRIKLQREINSRELDLYRSKSDRFPSDSGYRFEMGVRLLRAGQVDEAIRELQAVRSDPRHQGKALLHLGHCFRSRNNWRLAKRNFEEALQHVPAGDEITRKDILFQLAQGCAEAGDLGEAVEFGSELANMDFTYRDIGQLLDEWQARPRRHDAPR